MKKLILATLGCGLLAPSLPAQGPPPGLRLWLKADDGVVVKPDGTVDTWTDQSGAGYVFKPTPHSPPQGIPGPIPVVVGGVSALRFPAPVLQDDPPAPSSTAISGRT